MCLLSCIIVPECIGSVAERYVSMEVEVGMGRKREPVVGKLDEFSVNE